MKGSISPNQFKSEMQNTKYSFIKCFCAGVCFGIVSCKIFNKGKEKFEPNIVNGVPIPIELYPFLVGIVNMKFMCGGSILNSYSVLTAAHCFNGNRDPEYITISAGSNYFHGGIKYKASDVIIHEDYNILDFQNDIALVFIEEPIRFGDKVKKAVLVDNQEWMVYGENIHVIGWGTTEFLGEISESLTMVALNYVTTETCSMYLNKKIFLSMFCLYTEGKDACQGDSGGGVVWNGMLVGIVSHGRRCAMKNTPGVYTNIYYLKNWIRQNVEEYIYTYCNDTRRVNNIV